MAASSQSASKPASQSAAQTGNQGAASPAAPAAPADPGESLPPDTPVITLSNLCATPTAGECKTVITKGEFEKLVTAGSTQTTVAPSVRARIVQPFAQVVVLDADAEKQGLDKQPEVENMLKVARMRALSQVLQQRLVKEAQQVTPEQVSEYYKQHQDDYTEAKIERLFIPKIAAGQNIDQAKAKAIAERLQKEAAGSKSLDELEKQAYTELGLAQQTPPSTDMGVRRKSQLPPSQQEPVFALSAGQVSNVIDDPNAFYVYKVDSKTTVPEANVSAEIKSAVAQKRYADELKSIFSSVDATLNPDYFGGMKTIDWNAGAEGERPAPQRVPGRGASPTPPTSQP